jgi:hypothetical protein
MVPTSSAAKGDRTRSIIAVDPVLSPGDITEVPLNTSMATSWPLYRDKPTSKLSSLGCPMRILPGSDFGTKRTSPFQMLDQFPHCGYNLLLKLEVAIALVNIKCTQGGVELVMEFEISLVDFVKRLRISS